MAAIFEQILYQVCLTVNFSTVLNIFIRLLLSPFYGIGFSFCFFLLYKEHGALWTLIYLIAIVLVLLPTPLLEPRYFTQPVVYGILNLPQVSL
jgi:phosphate/sulfate permease